MDRNGSALRPPGTGRSLSDDLMVAFELADIADQIVTEHFRPDGFPFEDKHDGSPVTEIDQAVERAIRARLNHLRPDEPVLGEEAGEGDANPHPRPLPEGEGAEHGVLLYEAAQAALRAWASRIVSSVPA